GSLLELAEDYKDYLRVHGGERWQEGSEKFEQCRKVCATHNDSAFYMERISERSNLTIANIALILLAQVDYLLFKHIEKLKREFLERGGKSEEMMRVRKQRRGW
ncbi:MAG: four helix bundle suffix domain-containing protein, partial [Prevotella sp.]|nr:four helix bundle suffix domain-containing protein [Prevotella sp.]